MSHFLPQSPPAPQGLLFFGRGQGGRDGRCQEQSLRIVFPVQKMRQISRAQAMENAWAVQLAKGSRI